MKRTFLVAAVLAAAAIPGAATAQLPVPTPTVTTPTVPQVTVPPVTVPQVPLSPPKPAPEPQSPPKAPADNDVARRVDTATSPGGGSGSGGGSDSTGGDSWSGSSGPTYSGSGSASSAPAPARVSRLRAPRPWISYDPRLKRKTTTLSVSLSRAGRVALVVKQLAPECRRVGKIVVNGRAGINRIPFRGRVAGRRLEPGTYRISTPGGLVKTRLVVLAEGTPGGALRSALDANVCGSSARLGSAGGADDGGVGGYASAGATGIGGPGGAEGTTSAGGVLGATGALADGADDAQDGGSAIAEKLPTAAALGATFVDEETIGTGLRASLAALAVLAIILLALAAAPRALVGGGAVAALAARRRLELTLAGVATLLIAAVTYLYVLAQG